ncbi:MAG TPA: hypothetical protein VGO11_13395 [Chthoniobacteraceae bacterium]|jgi:hypothetical protein|nr:hypothetical protein [Chthoniobacteraceae bacterium]
MNLLRLWIALAVLALPLRAGETGLAGGLAAEPFALRFSSANATASEAVVSVKAGTIWKTADGALFVALRSAENVVPARTTAALSVPAAALSTKAAWKPGAPVAPAESAEPRVASLLTYLATRNDVPRETSQLVVLALTENIGFADWQTYAAAAQPAKPAAPGGDVAVALDALTILRAAAPQGRFALASDAALKQRALHDPVLRGQARQLFGLAVPGDAPPGAVAPDLGQLMHTKPGDNCPICQMRAQMQKAADVP